MANQNNNFTRSNVNAATLQVTDPGRSSFNLGHKNELTIPFGKIVPVSTKILLPSDTFSGSLRPRFALEKIGTPSIGATRLDTHTFVVNFRRINKDMRKNLEEGANFFPSFDYYDMVDRSFGLLFRDQSSSLYSIISSTLEQATEFKELSLVLLNDLIIALDEYYANYEGYATPYYQRDKFLFLKNYYLNLQENISNTTFNASDPLIFFQVFLPGLLRPICGPSSLLDYLGYPIYSQYNKMVASTLQASLVESQQQSFYTLFVQKFTPTLFKAILMNTASFIVNPDTHGDRFLFVTEPSTTRYSELPLRAYYAVWYDYIRNWHIEERKNILDPDLFDNNLITNFPSFTNNYATDLPNIAKFLSFYTLRSRDYGTDFLTSIQTDDVFRHVYSPVFTQPNEDNMYKGVSNELSAIDIVHPSSLTSIYIPDSAGDVFNFPSDGKGEYSCSYDIQFAQDLQTMRRAGMLERWLARNYYYPDTYVGRLQARYGVRPSDYEVLVSQYIGGSESFISGQELVANMSTSESVVGSRNLKADVSAQDNFSGSVTDYSILISVVSTVPIVTYDVVSPSARITDFVDFPQPEFATDTRVEARVSDFLRGFSIKPFIGYVPRYYQFRVSADETHGRYLTDYRIYNWLRDNYSMSQEAFEFSLNPYSLRVNLPLNAFIGLQPWDDFAYGSCDVNLVVNRALPAAIEII